MLVRSVSRIALILIFGALAAGCEYGPFQAQTQSLPESVTVQVDDPFYLDGDYLRNQWYLDTINAREAWEQYAAIAADPVGGSALQTIPVAVIDSGIDGTHEDLRNVLARTGVDLVGGTYTPIPQGFPADVEGISHGTHVSGLVAAQGGNNRGIVGVGYNGWSRLAVRVVPIRSLEGLNGTLSDVIRGVLVAAGADGTRRTAPARVINMSLGADVEALDDPSILLFESAVEEAQRRGLLLVAASGNGKIPDGVDNAQAPQGQSDGIDWPARFPGVIAVGSVDRSADPENSPRSYFSDYGLQLELMAPGAESSGPDADDTTGIVSTVPIEGSVDGAYATQAGTSMAAPLVAGAAALVWSANPHLSADQIRRILQQTALDLGDPGRDEEFGYGLLDVGAALQRASTTPYGRYGSSTESGAAVALEDEITARQLIRSKQNTRYQQSQPVDFIVYVGEDIDHETFHRRVVEVVPEARVESLGFLPLGSAIRVSVDASSAASVEGGVDGPALFRFLQDDPAVLSVTQNRTIQFYRP